MRFGSEPDVISSHLAEENISSKLKGVWPGALISRINLVPFFPGIVQTFG